ncbi:hypothetical protein AGOR_G00130090 [Albula goreensis]|uniref:Distal membrane-arm assembly complex protein 2 n=1 Tax=Albula goreensis TaxID=1534307 RepID=A0A8T3D921_9TELE|nr:hypothetical protein AGOR_G00130090 [Albula goreensis]
MATCNMARSTLMRWRGGAWTCLTVARRSASSAPEPVGPPTRGSKLLLSLSQWFHDVEAMLLWRSRQRSRALRKKNAYYGYTQFHCGDNVASAYFILSMRGAFRFAGQSEWFRPNARGKFSWDFRNFPEEPIEEVDMSGTQMNYVGLDNLVNQRVLRSLSVRGCPEVDDWFLSRLHIFQDSLEELDLSHCPRITVGGLASLHRLRKLQRLDLSSLPRLQNPGQVRILLEEVLPHCQVSGVEYSQGLLPRRGAQTEAETETETNLTQRTHTHTLTH